MCTLQLLKFGGWSGNAEVRAVAMCAGPECQNEVSPPATTCSDGCRLRHWRQELTEGAASDLLELLRTSPDSDAIAALCLAGPTRLQTVRAALSGAVVSRIGNAADVRR